MSKIPSSPLQVESWARCLGGCIFFCSRGSRIFFFNIFLPLKESLIRDRDFFIITSLILSRLELSRVKSLKLTASNLMENCEHFICPGWSIPFLHASIHKAWHFENFIFKIDASLCIFKITCILLRHVISLKKMVVLSAKFTILISWSPICILLFLLWASMKLSSTSTAICTKSIESGNPSWILPIRVKGSDRRTFILILDWMLVYATLIMWMNLSPCQNFCKTENQSNSKGFEKILICII